MRVPVHLIGSILIRGIKENRRFSRRIQFRLEFQASTTMPVAVVAPHRCVCGALTDETGCIPVKMQQFLYLI